MLVPEEDASVEAIPNDVGISPDPTLSNGSKVQDIKCSKATPYDIIIVNPNHTNIKLISGIPSKTRYAGFFAGGCWLAHTSLSVGILFPSNSNDGSSKHFRVEPGIDFVLLSLDSGSGCEAEFSPDIS